ncbi:hypothetical protein QBC36DRAFT_198965 [Triangularia setosa]|uniref:C2H2-type domain-containing protein n=1 Tax=Triangularia setosa TaxID=2587417 RepID=A0AAN7A2G5_9PEZI|nr:hypothetical protein QBC36DRAFT_198965 [Podospora setosa]
MMVPTVELACMEVSCQHILCSCCPIEQCWVKAFERPQSPPISARGEPIQNDERNNLQVLQTSPATTPSFQNISRLTEQTSSFSAASTSLSMPLPTTCSPRIFTSSSSSSSCPSILEDNWITTPSTSPEDTGNSEWDDNSDPIETHETGDSLPTAQMWAQLSEGKTDSALLAALERGYECWKKAPQNTANERDSDTSVGYDKNYETQGQTSGAAKSPRKRPHSEIDGDSGNDDPEERPQGGPRPNPPPINPTPPSPLLACPFWKEDSTHWKECFRYKLKRIRDVKQHLRRNHGKSYCARCGKEFEGAGPLESHYKQDEPCTKTAFRVKWLTELQKKALRESRANPKLSVEKQWYAIWDIVCPEIPKPDSPYLDSTISEDLSSFLEFFRQRGLGIIRETGESLGFHPGLMQERQLLQTFVARIYDRWASQRGHPQRTIASSPLEQESGLLQATSESDFAWIAPGILDAQEPSPSPTMIGLVTDNATEQERQINPQASVPDGFEPYEDPRSLDHSLMNTIRPSVVGMGIHSADSGMGTFDEIMIQPDDMPLVQSSNAEVDDEEQSLSLQIDFDYAHGGGLSSFDDTTGYHTGQFSESLIGDGQRAFTPTQTIFTTFGENLDLSNTQFDTIQDISLETFNVDSSGLNFSDSFYWDQNINFDGGSQAEDLCPRPTNCE